VAPLFDFLSVPPLNGGLLGTLQPQQLIADKGPEVGGRIGQFLSENPLMLMALGGGIAQGGIGRGLQLAGPPMQAEQQQQNQRQVRSATYDALRHAGVPPGQALAGVLNPDILKIIARHHFGISPEYPSIRPDQTETPTSSVTDPMRTPGDPHSILMSLRDNERRKEYSGSTDTAVRQLASALQGLNAFENKGVNPLGRPSADWHSRNGEALRQVAAKQMEKILHTTGMRNDEIRAWKESLDASTSLKDLRGAMEKGLRLLDSHLAASHAESDRATALASSRWLSPEVRSTLQKLRTSMQGQGFQQEEV